MIQNAWRVRDILIDKPVTYHHRGKSKPGKVVAVSREVIYNRTGDREVITVLVRDPADSTRFMRLSPEAVTLA